MIEYLMVYNEERSSFWRIHGAGRQFDNNKQFVHGRLQMVVVEK